MFSSLVLTAFIIFSARSGASAVQPRVVHRDADLASSYDFVVVGGGTSGLTVADRLTENPNGEQVVSRGLESK